MSDAQQSNPVEELENHLLVFIFIPGGGACARGAIAIEDIPKHDTWSSDEEFAQKQTKKNTGKNALLFLSTDTEPYEEEQQKTALKRLMVGLSMRKSVCFSSFNINNLVLDLSSAAVLYKINHFLSIYPPTSLHGN